MGFPRQEYWSRLPFPSAGELPDLRVESMSPAWQADSLPLTGKQIPLREGGNDQVQTETFPRGGGSAQDIITVREVGFTRLIYV